MLKVQPTDRIWWAYCRAHEESFTTTILDICTLMNRAMIGFVGYWWENTPFFTWLLGTIVFGIMSAVSGYIFVTHSIMNPQPFSFVALITAIPVDILLCVPVASLVVWQIAGMQIFFCWIGRGLRSIGMLLRSGLVWCIPTIVMRTFRVLLEAVRSVRRYCITDRMHMWRMVGDVCIFAVFLTIVVWVLYAPFTMSWEEHVQSLSKLGMALFYFGIVILGLAALAGLVFVVMLMAKSNLARILVVFASSAWHRTVCPFVSVPSVRYGEVQQEQL
jgi:hypothetical protein